MGRVLAAVPGRRAGGTLLALADARARAARVGRRDARLTDGDANPEAEDPRVRFDLDAEQEFFRGTTARFLEDHVPVATLRALRNDPIGYEPDYWRRGAELGWTSLLVSEAHGGGSISGAGLVDLGIIAHEFGRHAAPGPLVTANVVADALTRTGDAHGTVLGDLVAGTLIGSWCSAEPVPHDRLGTIALEMRVDADDVVLHGMKRPVESAADAGVLLVTGRVDGELTQVLVPTETPGVAIA